VKSARGTTLEEPNVLVVVIAQDVKNDHRFRFPDGPCLRGDESARSRGLSPRGSPSLSSLATTLPVMAQIDIEYAGRTYTVPWTDDNVERLQGIAQHVRDGRAEVFTVVGEGFALTIVVGPTIPLAITYVD
jgi:hypothetical protein